MIIELHCLKDQFYIDQQQLALRLFADFRDTLTDSIHIGSDSPLGVRVPDSFKYLTNLVSNLLLESVTLKIQNRVPTLNFLSNNDLFTDDFYFFYSVVKDHRNLRSS